MRSPKFPAVPAMLFAALIAAAVVDCGGDDETPAAGGSSGKGGSTGGGAGVATAGNGGSATAGNGGSAGASVAGNGGTAGTGGSAGQGGKGGSGGAADSGPDANKDGGADATDGCTSNALHTAPSVPSSIALTGPTLVIGYHAKGDQIYTCTETSDAGPDAGDGALTGAWVNTAEAVLTGDACGKTGDHYYPGPTWKATDGSTVSAARVTAIDPPGDGGAVTAIKWVLLKATGNTGEGTFTNVTYVQRVNTVGGLQPATPCDPSKAADAGGQVRVPYTADYYFYTGEPSEAGSDASDASSDGSADSGG